MIEHAVAANERLLKAFREGLCSGQDARTAHLDAAAVRQDGGSRQGREAVGKVLAEEKPTSWKLKADKYYYIAVEDIGLAGIDD